MKKDFVQIFSGTTYRIDYSSAILFMCNQTELNNIQRLQSRAMRSILKENRYTSVTNMLYSLDLLTVKQRIVYNVLNCYTRQSTTEYPSIFVKCQDLCQIANHMIYVVIIYSDFL